MDHSDVAGVCALMEDVVSRLPSAELFAKDDEGYFHQLIENKGGEIYGAFYEGRLLAYTVIDFPGNEEKNLGRECGISEQELSLVAVLDATVVHESARGLGLQRYFHRLRENRARALGYRYLYSTVHPDNLYSIRNLEEVGFTLQFTRPMYGGKMRHCYAKWLD